MSIDRAVRGNAESRIMAVLYTFLGAVLTAAFYSWMNVKAHVSIRSTSALI